ncbi:MAG: hypothetical protein AAGA95_18120, partial [Pseudomonadota bacterium]
MQKYQGFGFWTAGAAALLLSSGLASAAPDRIADRDLRSASVAIEGRRLEVPAVATGVLQSHLGAIDPSLVGATGRQQIIVRLRDDATASLDSRTFANDRISRKLALESSQNDFIARCTSASPEVRVLGQVQHVLNAVFLDVPASEIPSIAADADVLR